MGEPAPVPAAVSPPTDWPAPPGGCLEANRMGTFDWDLDSGRMHLDDGALGVFDLRPDEFDGRPAGLAARVPDPEAGRLDTLVNQALRDGSGGYGAYFRIRRRDGVPQWTHTQGHIRRDAEGRPHRIFGVVRDATAELGHAAQRQATDEERARDTRLVEEITSVLAHTRTVQDVRDALAGPHSMRQLGASAIVLGLIEAGRVQIAFRAPDGPVIRELESTPLDDDLPLNEAVRAQTPRYVRSREEFATRFPRLWRHFAPMGIASAAYLPLTAQGQPLGALGLLFGEERHFPVEEHNLLVALASGIAQGLQRAILFEQEHDLAENLQQAMLPRTIPQVPGTRIAVRYRSAGVSRDIGGDWYDVIPLPGGRVAAVIGDVEGHDTHATAVMGQLRIVLRAYAAEGHPAATVMARASAFLGDLDTERFATCLYAEHDPATGWLRLVRAGHLAPLLRRADATVTTLPVTGGVPLGIATPPSAETPVNDLQLRRGETLLMCTDGLVERRGSDLDEGIAEVLRALRTGPTDLERLADWVSEAGAAALDEDDMALVLLRRT
ncbi:SpoIIE family protein phosphatase [Streptomyces sp. B6B3]|uniref:SpoIIE family protein phosphatase n=1 Tax=Streptomyces sp. B6B3 TaxID=3153570 RepID=UPI00325CD442